MIFYFVEMSFDTFLNEKMELWHKTIYGMWKKHYLTSLLILNVSQNQQINNQQPQRYTKTIYILAHIYIYIYVNAKQYNVMLSLETRQAS